MNAKYTFDYWTRSTIRIIFNFLRGKQDLALSVAPALWNCYGFIAIAWKHYLYYVFAGVFFCSALLKLVVPIKTPQTVVYTCCVLGSQSLTPGLFPDSLEQWCMMGGQRCRDSEHLHVTTIWYHPNMFFMVFVPSWYFSKTQCLLVSTNQCNQFSLMYSEAGFPGLDPGSDPYRGSLELPNLRGPSSVVCSID